VLGNARAAGGRLAPAMIFTSTSRKNTFAGKAPAPSAFGRVVEVGKGGLPSRSGDAAATAA